MTAGKRLRRSCRYHVLRGLLWPMEILPRAWALQMGGWLGEIAWRGLRRHREAAEANIGLAGLGVGRSPREVGRQCFRALGCNAVDFLRLPRLDAAAFESLVTIEGEEHLLEAYRRGRGVVAAGGHIGNWELLGSYLAHRGLPIHVIARPLRDPRFDRFVTRRRLAGGVRCLSRETSLRQAVRLLRRGGVLGILCDQNTRGAGFDLPFFGRPAFTPIGPAALSRASGAALIPLAIHLLPEGRHRVTVLPEIVVERSANRGRDLREALVSLNLALEELILKAPEQWVWFHERWCTKSTPRLGVRRDRLHGDALDGVRNAGT